jgi:translocator protein
MSQAYNWYSQLKKPKFAPPANIFGPVWVVLYILILISYGYVGILFYTNEISFAVLLPFILNLIFNFAFTPIQFGLKNNYLAAVDIILVLITIKWMMGSIFAFAPWIVYINIPYLIWVAFATVLQLTVTWLNR